MSEQLSRARAVASPEEELRYLRALVAEKEAALHPTAASASPEQSVAIAREALTAFRTEAKPVLAPGYAMTSEEHDQVLSRLSPDNNDASMRELKSVLELRGFTNALSIVERTKDPHLEDDFHRYVVQYIASGLSMKERGDEGTWRALHMTLYRVLLPEAVEGKEKSLRETIAVMEQFLSGMLGVSDLSDKKTTPTYFSLELAVPAGQDGLSVFVAVPNGAATLFEKQLAAAYPRARLVVERDDYNAFVTGGAAAGSYATFKQPYPLSLRTYDTFDYDPLHAIIAAFAKVDRASGASLQLIIDGSGREATGRHLRDILSELQKGTSRGQALNMAPDLAGRFGQEILNQFSPLKQERGTPDQASIESVTAKIMTPVPICSLRLVASSQDQGTVDRVLSELEASFHQFAAGQGNSLSFTRVKGLRALRFYRKFSFRLPDPKEAIAFSLKEIATLFHFPQQISAVSPELIQAETKELPAPAGLPKDGILLGINRYRGAETPIHVSLEDRMRHFYVIGQTGTGKSVILKNMLVQDIKNGDGVAFIDPHGNDIIDILASVPPERYDDVIYVDPAYLDRSIGLNLLEYDPARPEQKTYIVNELLAIFRRLFGDIPESMGPAFEQYFRNATMLVMEDPSSGSTMLDIPRIMTDESFRALKVSRSKNLIINQFWEKIATQAGGEQALENYVPYVTNKFDDFIANDFVRPIISQQTSSFDFRKIIDERKILLVNLSKGRLGEKNANFIGLLLVGKIFMAALSRADSPGKEFPPFHLFIDEFQNITTDSIAGILSEARKYRLSLTIAHQFLKQVDEKIRDAVFGNVGSLAVFRVGAEDATALENLKLLGTEVPAGDLSSVENFHAYMRLLAGGVPQKPFIMKTLPPDKGNPAQVESLRELSYVTYGRPRAEVEEDIRRRYLSHS